MNIQELHYFDVPKHIKKQGVLIEDDGDELLTHYFDAYNFTHSLRKIILEDDDNTYHVQFDIGGEMLARLLSKDVDLRSVFISCKRYCIVMNGIYITDPIDHNKTAFADEYGPLYDTDIFVFGESDYLKKLKKEWKIK